MIHIPDDISDALDLESTFEEILASWHSLPEDIRIQEIFCQTDFYLMAEDCRRALERIQQWKMETQI